MNGSDYPSPASIAMFIANGDITIQPSRPISLYAIKYGKWRRNHIEKAREKDRKAAAKWRALHLKESRRRVREAMRKLRWERRQAA